MYEINDSPYLQMTYCENFINKRTAKKLFQHYSEMFEDNKRRQNLIFGDRNLDYTVTFGGYGNRPKTVRHCAVIEWKHDKYLLKIKRELEKATAEKYTVCVIQFYPNGNVGINPHKDREMVAGTLICGISLGSCRNLVMHPPKFLDEDPISIRLRRGSLYIMHPPTNDYWLHSIEKDKTKSARISLTFRNY